MACGGVCYQCPAHAGKYGQYCQFCELEWEGLRDLKEPVRAESPIGP